MTASIQKSINTRLYKCTANREAPLRNIIGSIVEGDDFFPRPVDLQRFRERLDAKENLLLVAPRRVGKSSFVSHLCGVLRAEGWKTVELNVECCTDELQFFQQLLDGLAVQGFDPSFIQQVLTRYRALRKEVGGKFSFAGVFNLEISTSGAADQHNLQSLLGEVFNTIDHSPVPVVIALDEFPEVLSHIARGEHGAERLEQFLHWFRQLRQTRRSRIRWIIYGSVGLDGFVEQHNLGKTINDLAIMPLEALSPDEAHELLSRLAAAHTPPIELSPEARSKIMERIGLPLPFFLQLVFQQLTGTASHRPDAAQVDQAYARLLDPVFFSQFDTWRQRLDAQFADEDRQLTMEILKALSAVPAGLSRPRILDRLKQARPHSPAAQLDESLRRLLAVLHRDGYLFEQNGQYAFRSFLLRDYWQKRYGD